MVEPVVEVVVNLIHVLLQVMRGQEVQEPVVEVVLGLHLLTPVVIPLVVVQYMAPLTKGVQL
jgi:hypothetical protein